MTASRALRGAPDVSNFNVEKVRTAAKQIGYVGNQLASSLSGHRSDLIGVVVPSMANIVFAEVLAGIAEGIDGSGMQAAFGVTDYDAEKEHDAIRSMLSWSPAGLIVTGLDQPDDTRRLLKNAGIPVVQIMDTDGSPVDICVGFSHVSAGEAMARELMTEGLRNFGYIGCDLDRDTRARKRLKGFRKALLESNLDLAASRTIEGPSTTEAGRNLTAQILAEAPGLDCIYYANDDLAAGGAFHCISNGISVPEQVTLAGFNGLEIVQSLPVSIVTSKTPRREIGRTAVECILRSEKPDLTRERHVHELKPTIERPFDYP